MKNVRAFGFVIMSLSLFAAGAHAADPPVVHPYNIDPRDPVLHHEIGNSVGTYSKADWTKIIARLEREHPETLALLKKEGLLVKKPGAWDRGIVAISVAALGLLTTDSEHKETAGELSGGKFKPITVSDHLFRELKLPPSGEMEFLEEPHGEMLKILPDYSKFLRNEKTPAAGGLE